MSVEMFVFVGTAYAEDNVKPPEIASGEISSVICEGIIILAVPG